MNDFEIDRTGRHLPPDQFKEWMAYTERARNQMVSLIAFLGVLVTVAGTIILLAWSPWNG